MQKQAYEMPDLVMFGNIEAITAGQSYFSPRGGDHHDYDGSKVYDKYHDKDKDKNKWGWPWGGWNWHWW